MQNTHADNQRVLLDVNVTCPTRSHDSLSILHFGRLVVDLQEFVRSQLYIFLR